MTIVCLLDCRVGCPVLGIYDAEWCPVLAISWASLFCSFPLHVMQVSIVGFVSYVRIVFGHRLLRAATSCILRSWLSTSNSWLLCRFLISVFSSFAFGYYPNNGSSELPVSCTLRSFLSAVYAMLSCSRCVRGLHNQRAVGCPFHRTVFCILVTFCNL